MPSQKCDKCDFTLLSLTHIGNILGLSPSVIFGNKIQKIFLLWRFWWRHTSNIWNLVIISQNSKGYSTYTRNILSTWRHHRQKFALDFVSENDARWKTQFLDFVSEICQYGLKVWNLPLCMVIPIMKIEQQAGFSKLEFPWKIAISINFKDCEIFQSK